MDTGDRTSDARPWQFSLRDLFAVFVWAGVLFSVFGLLIRHGEFRVLGPFIGAPTVLLAFVMVGTRHRTWPEGTAGFVVSSSFFMPLLFAGGMTETAALDVIVGTFLTGSVGGATAAGVGAMLRGDHVVGSVTTVLMGLWWVVLFNLVF